MGTRSITELADVIRSKNAVPLSLPSILFSRTSKFTIG